MHVLGRKAVKGEYREEGVTQLQSPRAAPHSLGSEESTALRQPPSLAPGHADLSPPPPPPPQQALPRCCLCLANSLHVLGYSSNTTSSGKPSARASSLVSHGPGQPLPYSPSVLSGLFRLHPKAGLPGGHTELQVPMGRGLHVAPGVLPPQALLSPLQPPGERRGVRGAGRSGSGCGTLSAPHLRSLESRGRHSGQSRETDLGQPCSVSFSSW